MSRQDVLVTADWAEKNLGTEGIVFLEVDEDTTAYDGGHLPGAVKINWTTELQDQVRRDIVDREQFAALLSAKGVGNDDTVVLYGGNNNWFAAYAYWQFKLYGHGDVKLLDGGRKKWELDGRTLTTETADRPATTYTAQAPDTSIRAFRDEVVAAIGQKNLVDVRSPDEFSGKILAPAHLPQEQSQRPGHIPGAINIPWSKAANEDGTFKSDEDLAKLYGEEGFDGSRATIAYCRIGERSVAHVGRAARAARPRRRQELRRQLDRVRLAHRRADRAGRGRQGLMCGAPDQAAKLPPGTDLTKETVLTGRVRGGRRAGRRRVRAAARRQRRVHGRGRRRRRAGTFRFFAAPGTWTLRALSRCGNGEARVTAEAPGLHDTVVSGRLIRATSSTGPPAARGGPVVRLADRAMVLHRAVDPGLGGHRRVRRVPAAAAVHHAARRPNGR